MMSPSGTTELMKNLKRLSTVDERLAILRDRKAALEGEIQSVEEEMQSRKNEIEEKLRKIKEETRQEHRDEILLKETEAEITKVQTQLNTAKTNEELRIFKKKRTELQVKISGLEDAILSHLTGLDKDREEVEADRKALDSREEEWKQKELELRGEIAECEQKQNAELQNRAAVASQVPDDILSKYERVLAKEKRRPVVEVRDRVCQGCFMKITLQEVNRIWRGDDIVLCPYCSRILRLPEEEMKE
jgi:predicted  nucleic acid-binding Zn-ribbon protein